MLTKYTSRKPIYPFGEGDSDKQFKEILDNQIDWPITTSKVFVDLEYKK